MYKLYALIIIAVLGATCASPKRSMSSISPELLSRVDHLVYATPDLNQGIREIEELLGVRATPGGQHQGIGTRNALVALGPSTYLEIFAPDPDQLAPKGPRPYGIDNLKQSKLVAWFANGSNLKEFRNKAVRNNVPLGEIISGDRKRPDGILLTWQFTHPAISLADGIVPSFIDWGTSPHPAESAAKGATLVAVRAEHPNPETARRMLKQLELDLRVSSGPAVKIIATIDGRKGQVQLQ